MKGYILLEASISYIVVSLALVSLLPLFILSIRANKTTENIAVATHLAVELMEEVGTRKWDQKTPNPPQVVAVKSALGPDTDEPPADKRSFNDIDDFHGWTESPPLDPVMRPLAGFERYSRDVAVSYVDPDLKPSSIPTDYKKVTVCARFPASVPVCLDKVFANR
ncbi:MAG: hypothetical protein HY077_09970 [Elusimicrobia bacterium]|nr:hypothetical protein [Elusimicrobiota bacterium]